MAKLIDVAEKAGVSITTASMALSGKGRISNEVREKVNQAADLLDYRKSRQNRTMHWVILKSFDRENDSLAHFFNPLIRRISMAAGKENFLLSVLPVHKTTQDEDLLNALKTMKADCLLSIHIARSSLFDRLEKYGIPCIVINNTSFRDSYFTVCVDDFHGAYEGTLELIKSGHRKIAFLDYERENLQGIVMDRNLGFLKALQEKGITPSDKWIKTVKLNDFDQIMTILDSWLDPEEAEHPTALFLHDDLLAGKVQCILQKRNIDVPGDFSLIAPGDTRDYNSPETVQLSTMSIDTDLMGRYALTMMRDRLNGFELQPHALTLRPVFVNRGTIRNMNDNPEDPGNSA